MNYFQQQNCSTTYENCYKLVKCMEKAVLSFYDESKLLNYETIPPSLQFFKASNENNKLFSTKICVLEARCFKIQTMTFYFCVRQFELYFLFLSV